MLQFYMKMNLHNLILTSRFGPLVKLYSERENSYELHVVVRNHPAFPYGSEVE